MTDYKPVSDALTAGTDPAMLCMTCPWDRLCINPPTMTRDQVERQIEEARQKDEAEYAAGKQSMPVGSLMTAIAFGGRDTSASICPVLAVRLRDSQGKSIADGVRREMQAWGS